MQFPPHVSDTEQHFGNISIGRAYLYWTTYTYAFIEILICCIIWFKPMGCHSIFSSELVAPVAVLQYQSRERMAQTTHTVNQSVLNPDSFFQPPVSSLIAIPSLPVIKSSCSGGFLPQGWRREVVWSPFVRSAPVESPKLAADDPM